MPSEIRTSFDEVGEPAVRASLEHSAWATDKRRFAAEWLSEKDVARAAERDAREKETLAIAKNALSIATSQSKAAWRAARYTMYAAAIAATAVILQSKDAIFSLIFG